MANMCTRGLFWISLALACAPAWSAHQQQYFRVAPRNTRVHEGGEAVLECEISSLAGMVQWAKDGFALGYAAKIPGYPRYSMVGDRRHGVYNLRIANASLDDDAEFQCQVGPAQNHKVIRANASLTVIAPPTAVEIIGHPSGSKLEIREGADVSLECRVKNAKPAAKIVWYRGNMELKPDRHEDEIIEIDDPNGNRKNTRYTTKSRIFLKPTSEDDYAEFSCEARHEALQRDLPMRSSVQLSVLYPPGAPYIEGYAIGDTVRRGQNLELVCRSRGGNPPAQLIWYKNGEQIRMAYRTAGRVSENVLTFIADISDNKARYRCEAKNIMISNALKAEVDLTVLFAPAHVSISGPSEARVGDPVPLTCTTAPSNPAAEITWVLLGKQYKDAKTNRVVMSPEGGFITTSNITVVVEPNKRSIVVVCHGLNNNLTENVVSTHTINVLYPPSEPMIMGYTPGTILAAGTVQKLMCTSSGGNPLASLTWYKNDKKIHSTTKVTDKSVSADISILTNVTDNQAQYRCEAANSATEIPRFTTVTLSVHFAPEAVKVRVEPTELRPGELATLICDAASSNPPAALSWWRDGIPVQGLPSTSKPGLHGGTVSTIELKLNVTKEMNGASYTCQALNEALQRSAHDAEVLNVLYPPIFDDVPRERSGPENESLVVELRADGNPSSISYTWSKDGLPITHNTGNGRIISEGWMLNITRLHRHDAGIYTCEALNSQGVATMNISVSVNYPATITNVSRNIVVSPNDNAELWCTAAGNPLTEEHITWQRDNYKKFNKKTTTTFYANNGTSYLKIENADRGDVGNFRCVVNNGVGKEGMAEFSQDVMLIVKFAPEMKDDASSLKFASDAGKDKEARLACACNSAPPPIFIWKKVKDNSILRVNSSNKYYSTITRADGITHTATLHIREIHSDDYGAYECYAKNEMGEGKVTLKLDVTSAPDQVMSLKVTNVTHNTVTLEWTPGFDGGKTPHYKIRYRKIYDEMYKEEGPIYATTYTVLGLERSTDYVFSVMATNELGSSKYLPDNVKALTLNEIPSSVQSSSEEYNSYSFPGIFIITGTIVGTALILLNVLVIGFCLHRRTNKRIRALTELGELSVTTTPVEEKNLSDDYKQSVIVYVSTSVAILFLTNIALIACFLWRRRARQMKEQAGQSSKSATIEMYAPSSYNDTMTGETLSSVSEKSETYSADDNDDVHPPPIPEVPSMQSRHVLGQTDAYLMEEQGLVIPPPALDYPPPNYMVYDSDVHARTLPHPHRHKEQPNTHTLNRNSGKQTYVPAPSPMPPLDGSYYNMSSDRYLSYPPLISEYLHHNQVGRTPTPPHQYSGQPLQKPVVMNGAVPGGGSPAHVIASPPNYSHDMGMDRQSAGGTLRRQRLEKMAAVPPPDVTVLHATCNQKHSRSPQAPGVEKQPQSILKDTSRHKYGQYGQHGSPLSTSTPITNNSSQILTVQNLTSDVPQYGTIRKDKKNNVTIDESFNKRSETHVV